jgi:hypothetical protein
MTKKGSMVRREANGTTWQIVAEKGALNNGDLLVGMPGAILHSKNGAVGLGFLSDLDHMSPYPIIESAVQLHESSQADLELTLDRGRVDLVNREENGAAHVKVHVRKETWELTLVEPGTRIAMEIYGRWPRGVPFTKTPGPKDEPVADLVFLVIKGQVRLNHGNVEHTLKAPPGPSLIEWDSVTGEDVSPRFLEKLPSWATAAKDESDRAKMVKEVLEKFRQTLEKKPIAAAIEEFLNSDNMTERRLAVLLMGALDDLEGLGKAMRETKLYDVWDNSVVAVRHWIGRKPGQDQILYKRLVEVAKIQPVEAETLMQLLHSFGDEDLARPETYETLIDYLAHDRLGVRGLAYWHLSRLVPAGKEFGYNPLDSADKRALAIQKWKKLIPAGKLPPRVKPDNRKK